MKRKALWVVIGFVLFALVRGVLAYSSTGPLLDEATSTLHYVDHLTDTGTFIYHPNDQMFGFSAIMYPALLAVLKMILPHVGLAVDLVVIDIAFNIFLEYLCVLVLVWFFQYLQVSLVAAIGLSLVTVWHPLLLSSSQGGMETPLFVLCMLLTLAFVDRSLMLAAFWAGMAFLTRPEGAILMVVVLLLTLYRDGRFALNLRSNTAVYLTFLGFVIAFMNFHLISSQIVPGSVAHRPLAQAENPLQAFIYLLKAPAFLIPVTIIPWPVRSTVVLLGVVIGIIRWPKNDRALVFSLGVIILNFLLFALFNPPMKYWYPAPMMTLMGMIFYFGLYQLVKNQLAVVVIGCLILMSLEIRWVYFTSGEATVSSASSKSLPLRRSM